MTVILYSHESARRHVTPEGHPEQVARYDAVMAALDGLALERREAPLASDAELLRCHPAGYLQGLRDAVPEAGTRQIDADTHLSPGSLEPALRAVGGACAAVDAVLAGEARRAFVAMRPPGHHAEAEVSMGFCLFGTVAIAAKRALDHHALERVAVLDFDVHHGNGTQALLWDEPRVLFVSSQQSPLWPGTGAVSERGAHGQVVNLPLPPGSDGGLARAEWRPALERMRDLAPQLVLISAGFDAHGDDPLAQLDWDDDDYAGLTRDILDAAGGAPVVSCLEGGYDLDALGRAVRAHVTTLMETER
ncbi:histone deacetylase family protein [Paracoccus aestuarii]|uniref:Histone deacetylase family protein n=1 Tax=Paracoccus aestuarii TaxID=453842 RepID=A0A419A268_9RHOB|nr:histone deacetylase family protein [Paracoccus aestuarii]RJL07147.1 histone deacetylase family protein [Paracoccus aestuarii]WCQ99556.1 histone deacetylase family protein [Paracoccus aestuarii]